MPDTLIKGQPFPRLNVIAGPPPYEDTGFFFHHDGRATWVFSMKDPTAKEVAAIESGPLDLRLVVEAPVLSMIGTSPVMSAERTFLPPPGIQQPIPADTTFNIVLVDARDGRVLVTRAVDVGQDFADRVADTVNTQARQGVNPAALARAEQVLQSRSIGENKRRAVASCTVPASGPRLFIPPASAAPAPVPQKANSPAWDIGVGPGRPLEIIRAYGALYPDLWKRVDALRQKRWWPAWCFLPNVAAHALVGRKPETQREMDKAIIGGVLLASWRLSKGVYVFDRELAGALETTRMDRIPTEVVFRMPEQCLYIPVSWPAIESPLGPVHGFFAQIQLNDRGATPQLVLCFDTSRGHMLSWIELTPHSKLEWGANPVMEALVRRALPHLLYLCAEEPDVDGTPQGEVKPTKTKKGLRWFPSEKIAAWNVGVRLGATLRKARELRELDEAEGAEHFHGRPRPHLRRAHFHSFWTGPKDQANRTLISRWVFDALVNAKGADDLVTAVRPVE